MRHGVAVAKLFGPVHPGIEPMTAANDGPQHHAPADPERTQAVYEAHAAAWS
jgi:hypothetical protein